MSLAECNVRPQKPSITPVLTTKIIYSTQLNQEQSKELVEISIIQLKRLANQDRAETELYAKIQADFDKYLMNLGIFDIKVDVRLKLVKIYEITKLEIESMGACMALKKAVSTPKKSARIANSPAKRARVDEPAEETYVYTPKKKAIKHMWNECQKFFELYNQWQSKLSAMMVDNTASSSENVDPNSKLDTTNDKPASKRQLEEAKKEAVDAWRAKLRDDAIKLMDNRSKYQSASLEFLSKANSVLDKLETELLDRQVERNERKEINFELMQVLKNRGSSG
jgi:hypothetical protein